MAQNPYVNKVEYAGQTLMDITDTTAEPSSVAAGEVFYSASGARSVGTGALNIIDDTAGAGDTDKAWSADKLVSEFAANDPGNTHIWVGTSDTAASTREKAVTITGVTKYETGDVFVITFTNAQDYNGQPRLNINSLGYKNIRKLAGTSASRYQWQAGETLIFVYNGTYMLAVNNGFATTTYYGLTKLAASCTNTSSGLALTVGALNIYSERMIAGVEVYSADATYEVGDKVRYSWYIYECNTAITEAEEWNAEHWTQLPALQTQIDSIGTISTEALTNSSVALNKIGNVGSTDLQTQVDTLSNNLHSNAALTSVSEIVTLLHQSDSTGYALFKASGALNEILTGVYKAAIILAYKTSNISNYIEYVSLDYDGDVRSGSYNISANTKHVHQGSIRINSFTGTSTASGNVNQTFDRPVVILSAWSPSSGYVITPYPSSGADGSGKNSWWFHVCSDSADNHVIANTSMTIYYTYMLVNG